MVWSDGAKRTLFLLNIGLTSNLILIIISYLIPHLKLRSYSYFINHYNLVVEKVAFIYIQKRKKWNKFYIWTYQSFYFYWKQV
jgi:hypothetical protein